MSGKYLLDTNIVIGLFESDPEIESRLGEVEEIYLSVVVLGELQFGAANSAKAEANVQRVDHYAATNLIVGIDANTARRYGALKAELRRKGRPIPENDLWIAACALQHGLTLATRDRHFGYVDHLQTETW